MTLESRMHDGWQYKAEGATGIIARFLDGEVSYDEGKMMVSGTGSSFSQSADLIRNDVREYKFEDFLADLSAEVRRGTAVDSVVYGDYEEMVEEREYVLVELLGSCNATDLKDIEDALNELRYWGDTYDVWLGTGKE